MKRASERKRGSKAIPALGAAGLSLTLASEASVAATALGLDTAPRTARVSHEVILREDEIFDVSLATFTVFDKERPGAFRARGIIKATGCCEFACLAGQAASENNAYSPSVPRPMRPTHKPVRKRR
jgi:hypothetical protein